MKTRAYIALGSNLSNPLAQIEAAFRALARLPETELSRRSPSYRNRAVGPGRQPEFINAVAEVLTGLDPYALLNAVKEIEAAQGREKDVERWAPRVIDLDIVLFGNLHMRDERLTLPHPEMHRRRFVLKPLSDIAPGLEIPGRGQLRDLLQRAPAHELIQVASIGAAVETG